MAALAAEAAEDAPRASMIAAPRLATVGMKVVREPRLVVDLLGGVLAADLGVEEVGVLGGRVVAPDGHLLDVGDRAPVFLAQLASAPGCGPAGSSR